MRRGAEYAALEAVTVESSGKENEIRLTVGAPGAGPARPLRRPQRRAPQTGFQPGGQLPRRGVRPGAPEPGQGPADGRRRFLDAALCQLYRGI